MWCRGCDRGSTQGGCGEPCSSSPHRGPDNNRSLGRHPEHPGADALLEQLRARIRAKEADEAHQRAEEGARLQAELREQGARADFARAREGVEHAAGVRVWEQVRLHEEKLRQKASPFRLPTQDIRAIAEAGRPRWRDSGAHSGPFP